MTSNRVLLALAVASMLVLAGCIGGALPADPDGATEPIDGGAPDGESVDGALEIHHIDVGQADATLLLAPGGETMLIDSGDWRDDGEAVLEYLDARGVDRIDHLVATHGHADHIGGHAAVIERLETDGEGVGAVYDSGIAHSSQTYDRYLDAVETHDVTLYDVRDGDEFAFANATVSVYNPPAAETGSDLHYNSVALAVDYGATTYLTTGDAETDAESRMVDEHGDALDADVYQAGHHGSTTSSSPAFLDAVDPAVAVISSAPDSQYGHPHDEVLDAFADRNIDTYWTALHGDVVVRMDGKTVSVAPATDEPGDPEAMIDAKPDDDEGDDEGYEAIVPTGFALGARSVGA